MNPEKRLLCQRTHTAQTTICSSSVHIEENELQSSLIKHQSAGFAVCCCGPLPSGNLGSNHIYKYVNNLKLDFMILKLCQNIIHNLSLAGISIYVIFKNTTMQMKQFVNTIIVEMFILSNHFQFNGTGI